MVFAVVGVKDKNQSLLPDLTIKVKDRQALKLLEGWVTQLQVILPTLLKAITGLRTEFRECCKMICSNQEDVCDCDRMLVQFNTYVSDLEMYVQRANVLKEEAKSIARLVCSMSCSTRWPRQKIVNIHTCIALRPVELRQCCSVEKHRKRITL